MRLRGFEINAFGRLADFRATDLVDAPVIVLLGDNESGKTTFFEFVTTALFGFKPATREKHDYNPWSGAIPEGALELRLADGTDVTVRRRLRGTPDGRLVVGTDEEKLANHPLRWVGRLERDVYRSLHALSISEADELSAPVWKELEERLLGGAAFPFLRPARTVAAELEEAAGKLWRSDRRGKPRSKELEKTVRDLKRVREEAAARDRRIREIQDEKDRADGQLARVRDDVVKARAQLELTARITHARAALEELERSIERCRKSAPLDPDQARLLERRDAIEALAGEGQAQRADRQSLDTFRQAIERAAGRVANGAGLFVDDLSDEQRTGLDDLSIDALRDAIDVTSDAAEPLRLAVFEEGHARAALERLRVRAEDAPGADEIATLESRRRDLEVLDERQRVAESLHDAAQGGRDRLPAFVVGVLALTLAVAGSQVTDLGAVLYGAAAVVAGIAFWLFARAPAARGEYDVVHGDCEKLRERLGLAGSSDVVAELKATRRKLVEMGQAAIAPSVLRDAERALSVARGRLEAAQVAFDRARDAALELLRGLPLRDERLERLDGALVAALMLQRDALREERELRADLDLVETRIADRERRAADLATELARETGDDRFQDLLVWAEELTALVRQRDQEAVRGEELPDLLRKREEQREEEAAAAAELVLLGVEEDRAELDTVARLESEQQLAALEEEERTLSEAAVVLREEERHLAGHDGVDQVDGEIAALEEEGLVVARERDRLMLLANVLREAHNRYRQHHQPDVFRRASEYLRIVTNGRYESLEVADEEGDQHLEVRAVGQDFPLPVGPPLSRGTREQIHLAIRLALADHVDGDEPLPLVLDELFVNWDPTRTGRGLSVLRELGERRQILLMTCHPEFAERARVEAGAVVVPMPAAQ